MSVEVTERKMDAKRRVTIPGTMGLKPGSKVVIVASTDTVIIAADFDIAENLAKLLREVATRKKQKTLSEWETLITSAGLSGISSDKIDRAIARKIRRQDHPDVSQVPRGR
jgi:bifunctional DNA-binding transcriptional regulator/antitoxin component of YhaV-PrlF toxin-antitoxin module